MKARKGVDHQDQLNRIKRIEGQVRGIGRMIEERRYCVDILGQVKAIKAALVRVEANILENHIHHCVKKAMDSGSKKESQQAIEEILSLVKKSI